MKMALPERIAAQHRVACARAVLLRHKGTADRRSDAEHIEEIRRATESVNLVCFAVSTVDGVLRFGDGYIIERMTLLLPDAESKQVGIHQGIGLGDLRNDDANTIQLLWFAKGQWLQQDAIHDGKDRCVCAN